VSTETVRFAAATTALPGPTSQARPHTAPAKSTCPGPAAYWDPNGTTGATGQPGVTVALGPLGMALDTTPPAPRPGLRAQHLEEEQRQVRMPRPRPRRMGTGAPDSKQPVGILSARLHPERIRTHRVRTQRIRTQRIRPEWVRPRRIPEHLSLRLPVTELPERIRPGRWIPVGLLPAQHRLRPDTG
jgi:hypothetical protein